jgi:hypothetical protein
MKRLRRLPRIVRVEALAFGCILALMALNEYVDLPKLLFGEEATPLRHHEFLMESTVVCLVAAMVMGLSWFAERHLRRLDSLLVMCAWCRQVKVADRWMSIEAFLKERNATTPTFGLCPACYEREAAHAPRL